MGKSLFQRRAARGFTLVEVLVALVVTSLLISILVSALYYMFRVQYSLQGEIVIREADLRAKAWFADAIANCLPVEAGSGVPFAGSSTEIKCETTAALNPAFNDAPAIVTFSLKRSDSGLMVLTYQETGGVSQKAHVLAEWISDEAEFRYVNIKGEEMDRWPKERTSSEILPRFVNLSLKTSEEYPFVWVVALRNDPWLEELPKNPFGLLLN